MRPHGIRGEVLVEMHTDEPGQRFAAGATLATEPASAGPLTVVTSRSHTKGLIVAFSGIADRTMAESARGVWLMAEPETGAPESAGADVFHDRQLIGLTVATAAGELVGTVTDVLHHGQDLLVVSPAAGGSAQRDILVPFVAAIVIDVDITAGRLVVDPPDGLLDLASG